MRYLIAFMLAMITAPAHAQDVTIYFLCQTPEQAEEVARNTEDNIPGISALPGGCRWISGRPENLVQIDEIINTIQLPSGDIVHIGRVSNPWLRGYSAGYLHMLHMS